MRRILTIVIAALALAAPQVAWAETSNEQAAVDRALAAVESLKTGPGAPPNLGELLHKARGVMIFPELVKAGFFFGAQGGSGVLLSRDPKSGAWSYPAFYGMGAGSFGLQIGVEVSKIMLIIMNDRALNAVMAAEFKIGAEAGIAVVTLGAGAEASTTAAGGADIYALAESAGLFGGVAIQGGIVKPRVQQDHNYYGGNVTAQQIVLARSAKNPAAEKLRTALFQVSGR